MTLNDVGKQAFYNTTM